MFEFILCIYSFVNFSFMHFAFRFDILIVGCYIVHCYEPCGYLYLYQLLSLPQSITISTTSTMEAYLKNISSDEDTSDEYRLRVEMVEMFYLSFFS